MTSTVISDTSEWETGKVLSSAMAEVLLWMVRQLFLCWIDRTNRTKDGRSIDNRFRIRTKGRTVDQSIDRTNNNEVL
jgi:hypothetical protein